MPEYLWQISFFASLTLTVGLVTLIIKHTFKTGIEHFSGRILIISSIVNTVLCGLLFLLQGGTELYRIAASPSSPVTHYIVPILFLLLPSKIVWNYFTIQRRTISQFKLTPYPHSDLHTTIVSLSKTMAISIPTIVSSEQVSLPFVFGHRSHKAILAVPPNWQKIENQQQYTLLLHELAHIRNHDVGFLAWATACLHDLRWFLLILPALILYCHLVDLTSLAPSAWAYLACSVMLFTMLRYVIRQREFLADTTAAMLIDSIHVGQALSNHQATTFHFRTDTNSNAKLRFADKVQRWLTDKALFASHPKRWSQALRIYNFFYLLHPSTSDRLKAIQPHHQTQPTNTSLAASFWAGISLGLLGVIIGLGGYWYALFVQNPQDEIELVHLSFSLYGIISPMAVGFVTLYISFPILFSLKQPLLNIISLLTLSRRYALAFIGATLTVSLILTVDLRDSYVQILAIVCLLWLIISVFLGYLLNITIIFLWIVLRYFHSSRAARIKRAIIKLSPLIILLFSSVTIGLTFIFCHRIFDGVNLICSILISTILMEKITNSVIFSELDMYMIVFTKPFIFRFEGRRFPLGSWLILSCYSSAIVCAFTILFTFIFKILFEDSLQDLDQAGGALFLLLIIGITPILAHYPRPKKIEKGKMYKIEILNHCLIHLKLFVPVDNIKLNRIISRYNFSVDIVEMEKTLMSVGNVFMLSMIVPENTNQGYVIDYMSRWLLECQNSEGFGIWPGSSPRLSATYQALSILQKNGKLPYVNSPPHIAWIKTYQQQDGSFKGPFSNHDPWQDTFFAVESLNILGGSLAPDKLALCQTWCKHILINQGLPQDRSDIIYYTFASLATMNQADTDVLEAVSVWLADQMKKLLLTNIALDYENVHHTLMIYRRFPAPPSIPAESLNLLAQRIQTALEAELADIRI